MHMLMYTCIYFRFCTYIMYTCIHIFLFFYHRVAHLFTFKRKFAFVDFLLLFLFFLFKTK